MKIAFDKILVKETMEETTITNWYKPKGFDLAIITISDPLFRSALNLVLGKYKEFKRFLLEICDHEIDREEPQAILVFFTNKKDDNRMAYFMLIQSNDWLAEDYGTISHELHHFVHISLDKLGVKHSPESEETFAYKLGYFMERVVRAFMMYKKKVKPKNAIKNH